MLNSLQENPFKEFLSVVWSTCLTETLVYPITTARIRMQMKGVDRRAARNDTLPATIRRVVKREGYGNLYSGVPVSFLRQVVYHGFRLSMLYRIDKGIDNGSVFIRPEYARAVASVGAVALIQPMVVTKVRYQAGIYKPKLPMHRAFMKIYKVEGIRGLFRGLTANSLRSLVTHISDTHYRSHIQDFIEESCPLYSDQTKFVITNTIFSFLTTLLTNPIDVTRNRYINSKPGDYNSTLHCITKTLTREGPLAFYRGYSAYYYSTFISNLIAWNIYQWTKIFVDGDFQDEL